MTMIQKLRRLSPGILSRYPVKFAYLYGSYATDCAHPHSDLDIGVYLQPEAMKRALDIELDLALEVDQQLAHIIETEVRAINNLPLTFKGRILTEGILLYCRDERARIEFEVQVRKKYFDFLPMIQRYHRAYINEGIG